LAIQPAEGIGGQANGVLASVVVGHIQWQYHYLALETRLQLCSQQVQAVFTACGQCQVVTLGR
jgi:hypothetical protein